MAPDSRRRNVNRPACRAAQAGRLIAPGVERDSRYTPPMPALTLVSAMTLSATVCTVVSTSVGSGKVRRIIVVVLGGGTSLGVSGGKVKARRANRPVHRFLG